MLDTTCLPTRPAFKRAAALCGSTLAESATVSKTRGELGWQVGCSVFMFSRIGAAPSAGLAVADVPGRGRGLLAATKLAPRAVTSKGSGQLKFWEELGTKKDRHEILLLFAE